MDYCPQHSNLIEKVNEIHGDVKVLVSEFRAMNGSLRETKVKAEEHIKDGVDYRNKVNIIWSTIHTIKWAIGLTFGTGLLWKLLEMMFK